MIWIVDSNALEKWGGLCTKCKWFDGDDNAEPCTLCVGGQTLAERMNGDKPCYFNAEPIEAPDVEHMIDETLHGVKDKAGKPQMRLILPKAATALVRVREYGLKKYPNADNWKSVPKDDWLDAHMRHMMAYLDGERIDKESGLPHLWHALANLSYMIEGEQNEN